MAGPAAWWRHLALAGAVGGLIASRHLDSPAGSAPLLALALAALPLLRAGGPDRGPAVASWLVLLTGTAALGGLLAGDARLASIAAGAAPGEPGDRVAAAGFLTAAPKVARGELRAPLSTGRGRLLLVAGEWPGELTTGVRVRAVGELAEPEPWRAGELERLGADLELRAARVRVLPGGRGGLWGFLDRLRARAERGVAAGMGEEEAALARGFVLGQDERIGAATRESFKRSGLAHLLAVSGQNVVLLAILAGVALGLAGVAPRARLLVVLGLIALYVPIAGAGPSIQRAGVMGAAAIVAGLAGRPADRAYLPLLAATATLVLNPHSAADVGWQLSFAAVIGIALAARPLADLLTPSLRRALGDRLASPLTDGAAMTVTATAATAPLMAHHFGAVSLAALPANLLALPAVAPVMWLGMIGALAGQVPLLPAAPLGMLAAPLIGWIDIVAAELGRPGWALVGVELPSLVAIVLAYLGLAAAAIALGSALRRRRGMVVRGSGAIAALTLAIAALASAGDGPEPPPLPARTLRVTMLDVGQGDATLLQQRGRAPILIDAGPPGAGLGRRLRELGVGHLAAVVISHDQLDHAGGLADLDGIGFDRLLAGPGRAEAELAAAARDSGASLRTLAAGAALRQGRLRIDVLSPPQAAAPAADPNDRSLVLLASYGRRRALLTGDAEAEAVPLSPGRLDLLKVAHHGSADAGLGTLIDRSRPAVALIGVGAGNRHGHPALETLATLAGRGVCALRTDFDGELRVDLGPAGMRLDATRDGYPERPGCTPSAPG